MDRRLYFILPDLKVCRQVFNELLLARVHDDHIHFLGKRGTDLGDLPEATSIEKTDITHGLQVGLISGALGGALIGYGIYAMQSFIGMEIQSGIILFMFILGAVFGAWVSGLLIGSSTPNSKLKQFEPAMEAGHILLMVDVGPYEVEDIRTSILKHHPEAEDHGVEPTIPVFP